MTSTSPSGRAAVPVVRVDSLSVEVGKVAIHDVDANRATRADGATHANREFVRVWRLQRPGNLNADARNIRLDERIDIPGRFGSLTLALKSANDWAMT